MTTEQQLTSREARIDAALHSLQADGSVNRGEVADTLREAARLLHEAEKALEPLAKRGRNVQQDVNNSQLVEIRLRAHALREAARVFHKLRGES